MKKLIHIIFYFLVLVFPSKNKAQLIPMSDKITRYSPLTLEDKVNKSDAIIEGVVISGNFEYGFRGPKGNLFSSRIIRISKIFKGEIKDTIIELITEGGVVPDGPNKGGQTGSEGSFIGKGEEGIFFLRVNNSNIQSGKNIQSYFLLYPNSHLYYNGYGQRVTPVSSEGMKRNYHIDNELYPDIESITGIPAKVLRLSSVEVAEQKSFDPKNYKGLIPLSDKIQPHAVLSLADKINKSDAVIEGRVIDTDCFFKDRGGIVFTSVTIRVSRIFKGEIKDTIIELMVDGGGPFPNGFSASSMWGMLYKEDEGVFYLRVNNTDIQSKKGLQSFLYLYPKSAMLYKGGQPTYPITYDGTRRYYDLDKELYPAIEAVTGTPAKVVGVRAFEQASKKQ